jgi:hypothetical protein
VATLDQLPADRRAIIELVLQRGQSYAELSEMLGMPEDRVREHARDALASPAPRSADRVDPHWRDQVADYVLGQQAGPQGRATRSHLRSSEAARTWAVSLLDSVGHLYRGGREPVIPAGSRRGEEEPERERRRPRGRETDGAVAAPPPASPRERPRRAAAPARSRSLRERVASASGTSAVVRRRRIAALLAALAAVLVIVLLATGALGGGGDEEEVAGGDPAGDAAAAAGGAQVIGQVSLQPVDGGQGAAAAQILEQEGQRAVALLAKLPKTDREEGYLLWLYNDREDAVAIALLQTDGRGNFQGFGPLPPGYEQYDSLDISLQSLRESGAQHSGNSVLRADLSELQAPAEGAAAPAPGALPEGGGVPAPGGSAPPGAPAVPGTPPPAPEP